ncbi:MAG: translation initiation factor 2 [Bacillota bacterium]|nr:translation initiation factor 2 [Bacillota bacterium]
MMFTKSYQRVKSNTDLPMEVKNVVKGTARRIIVVKSPDKKVFEEAIFIVREEYLHSAGITQTELMKEARAAAKGYVGNLRHNVSSSKTVFTAVISAVAGSGISVVIMKIFGL